MSTIFIKGRFAQPEATHLSIHMHEIAARHELPDGTIDTKSAWYELLGYVTACADRDSTYERRTRIEQIMTGEPLTAERAEELISAIKSRVASTAHPQGEQS